MSSCDYRDADGRCFGRGQCQFGDIYCMEHAHIGEAAEKARADLERRTVELLRALKAERDANARDHYMNAACCPTCDVVALLAEWEARRAD